MLNQDTILTAIEQVFPCTKADIIGRRKRRSEAEARHLYFWILRNHTRMSLNDIGSTIDRSHHNVLHAVRTCQALYDTCRQFRLMANKVLDALDLQHDIAA